MRIAHITATFPPYYSGTGTVCYESAVGLARRGHSVQVITAAHPPGIFSYPHEITVRRLPIAFRIGNAPLTLELLGLRDVDLIHLHYPYIFGAELVWAAAHARGIPFVLTHHNDLIGDGLRPLLFDSYTAISSQLLFGSARKLIAVSLDYAANCRLTPRFRQRWSDTVEVPNGVDATLFHPGVDGSWVRRQHGIPIDAPVVLFVGVLDRAHHFKGVDRLLEAFARIDQPDAYLLIVGDGELQPALVAQSESLGIGSRTVFAGKVANRETPPYYATADLVALPTAPPESFGMVLIEAMACGTPVVTSDIPGVRSVVSAGQDGLLTPVGDIDALALRLGELLADPARRRAMGLAGRAKVERMYSWPAIIDRLEQVYADALGVVEIGADPALLR